jgi:hypothetical protein
MASFTDEISKFNPYVQQLPVEAMTQVGMYKQQQYDQGVQKIQSYVDNIAGIDVYKPEQKQYLQSKLNELGGRLRTVAAGDFSNAQLVNSVGGMATQVIKDPIIQSAIYSTQVVRKGDADREVAAKAGKTSPNNDLDWEDQKAQWLNDGKLDSRFNGKYIEHWDVDKKLMERAEKILKNPDVNVQEQRFKHDEKGNTLYYGVEQVKDASGKVVKDKKGKPVTRQTVSLDPSKGDPIEDEAITRISIKGVSPEKLYNNFLDSLDSRDAQQLRIDAKAKYRGATMESFAPDIIKTYDSKKKLQSQEIVNISLALMQPNLTSEQQNVLKARLTDLQNNEKDGKLDKELNATLEQLKDPAKLESFKEHIYTQQYLIDMANDMSYKSYEQEIKNNPYMQVYMEKQKLNFDMQKAADESRRGWANYNLAKEKEAFDRYAWGKEFEFKTEKEKRDWLEKNPQPVITTSVLPTTTVPQTVDSQWQVAGQKAKDMKTVQNKYASILFPNMNNAQREKGFSILMEKYNTNPTGDYSPDEKNFLREYYSSFNDMMNASKLGKAAEKNSEILKTSKYNAQITGVGEYSGADIGDIVSQIKNFESYNPRGGTKFNKEAALNFFKTYKGGKYLNAATAYVQDRTIFSPNLTALQLQTVKAIDDARDKTSKIDEQVSALTSEFLAKNTPKTFTQDAAYDLGNDKQKSAVTKYLTSVAIDQNAIGAGDANKVLDWLSSKSGNKTGFAVRKHDDGTVEGVFVSPDGSSVISLPMNTNQQGFFPEVKQSSPYGKYKNYIEISPNRTTDVLDRRSSQVDPAAAVSATITGFELPGLKDEPIASLTRFTIEGDRNNNGSSTDRYSLNMFVKEANSPVWKAKRITSDYVGWGGIENILNNVGKDAYYEALKTWK